MIDFGGKKRIVQLEHPEGMCGDQGIWALMMCGGCAQKPPAGGGISEQEVTPDTDKEGELLCSYFVVGIVEKSLYRASH